MNCLVSVPGAPFLRWISLGVLFAVACCAQVALAGEADTADLKPQRLRCEYRTEPLGVDRPHPELSWIVASDTRDQVQTAYRILVASDRALLDANEGDLWDTGKVEGSTTYGVVYAGAELKSHQPCYWKVMVWDGEGRASAWSPAAYWSMGILDAAEWQGDWIGYDAHRHLNSDPPPAPLHGASWICHPGEQEDGQSKEGQYIYLGVCDLPAGAEPSQATLTVSADDSSIVLLNDIEVARTPNTFQPVTEQVAPYVRPGRNVIRVWCRNNSRGPTGICLKLEVTTQDGQQHAFTTDADWRSLVDDQDSWKTRSFDGASQAQVLGPFGMEPWGLPPVHRDVSAPPSYIRGNFTIERPVSRAVVYLASLGLVDLTLNGQLVNTDYFTSGWTDYNQRVYYRAYEVTDSVVQGENACGAVLADGWYSGHVGWNARRDIYGKRPRFRALIRVEYEDGSHDVFATDGGWSVTEGPTKLADFLVGEEYDATAQVPGWDEPGHTPPEVGSVDVGAEVSPQIEWHPGPPVVEVGEFPARSVSEPLPGVYVFDVGQNLAGVVRIKVRGRKGQRIMIRHAERLNPDGTLYTANLRLARAVDFYTCQGKEEEIWQPRQTFHGFQYVELTGLDEQPPLEAVTAIALSSDTPLASEFECSDPQINRLYQNVLWTQRANFIDIPTDCPQRDERLGWTGDAQVYVYTACRVADVQAFFRKWLTDLSDAQRDDGQVTRVAPVMPGEDDGGPAWADAGVICPWEVYQAYGDVALLERQYPSMVKFVEFCRKRSQDEVLPPKAFHAFGDWLSVNANTPREVIYMAYYARSVDLLQQTAEVLGKHDDAQKYANLLKRIKQAFVDEFIDDEGHVRGRTQCGYVLAIGYGLVEGDLRHKSAQYLVEDIESRGWKLSTGFVGTKDLMLVLSDIGRTDVALRLLHQTEYPGWLFSISHGATSIWERWDGWTPDRGFQDPGMNSFSHYSFGAVYGWMVKCLGGIRSTEPGFGQVVIEPTFDPALEHCRVLYDSIRGPIETEWKVSSGKRSYRVRIPANVSARLRLAGHRTGELVVDEKSLADSGLEFSNEAKYGSNIAVITLPSGEYVFTLPH